MPTSPHNTDNFLPPMARRLLVWHLAITAGYVVFALLLVLRPELSARLAPTLGPLTNHVALIVSMVLTWLLVTVVLLMAARRPLATDDLILLAATALLSLLYLVILREHVLFGDFQAYIRAAHAINDGVPFHARYIYPPLWASLLAVIQSGLGHRAAEIFCFALNHISLVAFLPLAVLVLERCGLSRRLAALLMLIALAVNVPVLRNVVYVQINLLVLDLVLVAVLAAPRHWLLAGLALAVSTHLKVLPVLVLPLFVLERRWRFLAAYFGGLLLLFAATAIPHGLGYWGDFLHNLCAWQPPALRSASVPGLLASSAELFGIPLSGRLAALPLQLALAALAVWLSWQAMVRRVFTRGQPSSAGRLIDGLVPALFLWPILQPGVWVYHLVVLILPAVVMATRLRDPRQSATFIVCYFLVFLYPTIDIYPWSYLRLGGWLGLLALLVPMIQRGQSSPWLPIVDSFLAGRNRTRDF